MAIEIECPSCGGTLQVGDDAAGRVIRCGGCMAELRVPRSGGPATAAAPDPYDIDRPAVTPGASRSPDRGTPQSDPTRRADPDRGDDRPRRRRPPPPPPGKGVFFWLVVVGAIMLVGVGACCGGFFLLVPGARWQKHESKDGGFRVQMPARPQPETAKSLNFDMGKDAKSEGAVLLKRGGAHFIVFYRDVPAAKDRPRLDTDERLIERETKTLLTALRVDRAVIDKPPTARPGTVGGFESREIDFTAESGFYTAKVIAADTRVYVLLGGGGVSQPGDPDVRKFIESFEIIQPELVEAGKRRAERAERVRPKDDDEPPKPAPKPDADAARAAAEAIAAAAVGAAREEVEAQEREQQIRRAAEAADARSAAATVAAVALNTARRDARPPLPVAPPPRPVE